MARTPTVPRDQVPEKYREAFDMRWPLAEEPLKTDRARLCSATREKERDDQFRIRGDTSNIAPNGDPAGD